jgi:hypothetical protein
MARRPPFGLTLVVAMLAVASAPANAAAATGSVPLRVTSAGVGGVRLGTTLADAKQRLGVTFVGARFGNELDGAICGRRVRGEAVFNFRSGRRGSVRSHSPAASGQLRGLRQDHPCVR